MILIYLFYFVPQESCRQAGLATHQDNLLPMKIFWNPKEDDNGPDLDSGRPSWRRSLGA